LDLALKGYVEVTYLQWMFSLSISLSMLSYKNMNHKKENFN